MKVPPVVFSAFREARSPEKLRYRPAPVEFSSRSHRGGRRPSR